MFGWFVWCYTIGWLFSMFVNSVVHWRWLFWFIRFGCLLVLFSLFVLCLGFQGLYDCCLMLSCYLFVCYLLVFLGFVAFDWLFFCFCWLCAIRLLCFFVWFFVGFLWCLRSLAFVSFMCVVSFVCLDCLRFRLFDYYVVLINCVVGWLGCYVVDLVVTRICLWLLLRFCLRFSVVCFWAGVCGLVDCHCAFVN